MARGSRVVVTGMGAVSASGTGVEPFWNSCVEGRSSLRPIRAFDARALGVDRGGEAALPVAAPALEPATAMALLASDEALQAAGLSMSALPRGAGVVMGSCLGGALLVFDWLDRPTASAPALSGSLAAPALAIAGALHLSGPVSTVSTACASGTGAIALAADCIRRGEADLMLGGGADALSRFVVAGFSQLRALSSGPVRPFDRRRDGLALGEGAAVLVLEEREAARRRGARILAEVLGAGRSSDANHMTGPSRTGDGVVRAVEAALRDARLAPDRIGFVSAHGTGTQFNDRMETIALKRVLGDRAHHVPVNSIKPIVGHTLGAAGALEAILCVRALLEGVIPPTINYEEADPDCDLDYVPNVARRHSFACALSSSSAFGGNNAAILLGGRVRLARVDPPPVIAGAAALVPPGDGSAIDVPAACREPAARFRRMDRYAALGFAAARLALADSGRRGSGHGDPEWGTLFGSSLACWGSNAEYFRCLGAGAPPEIGPSLFARTVCNAVNGEIAIAEQLGGESETLVSGWAAGAEAIAEASAWIAGGRVRWAVAGGIEAPGPDQQALHAAYREEDGNGWLPPRLEEAAAVCVLSASGEGPRVRAYGRGHDPAGDFSLAATLAALRDHDVSHVIVANHLPSPLLRRLEAEAGGREVVFVPRTAGELGAAGGALAATLVRTMVPAGRTALVIARGIEGGTVVLAVTR